MEYLKLLGAFTLGFIIASFTMCSKKNKEINELQSSTKIGRIDTLLITHTSTDTIQLPSKIITESKIVTVVKYQDVEKEVTKVVPVNVPIDRDKIIYVDSNKTITINRYKMDTTINDRKITTKVTLQGTLLELSTSVANIEKDLPIVKKNSNKFNSIGLRSGVIWDNGLTPTYKKIVIGANLTIQNVSLDVYYKHGVILGYNFKF